MTNTALKFGLVGLGGFATGACKALLAREPRRPFQLTHVYDPEPRNFPELVAELQAHHVTLCRSYEAFLATPIQALWLPVPIDLHRPYTEQALRAGKAVLCEKPAAGCVQDVDAMIAARDGAKLPVAIGFQDIYTDSTFAIKTRLLAGAIGTPRSATLFACWPRDENYYARPWAAKLQRNGTWLLDSPANNALAHFINLAMFFLGETMANVATPVAVEAELYRANAIENYDTCSIRIHVAGGVPLTINLTHACQNTHHPIITLVGERGTFTYDGNNGTASFGSETLALTNNGYENTLRGFERHLFEPASPRPYASLEMARAHSLVISAANQIAPVRTIGAEHIQIHRSSGRRLHAIPGIEEAFRKATAAGQMLHESKLLPWTRPGRRIEVMQYNKFTGPAQE